MTYLIIPATIIIATIYILFLLKGTIYNKKNKNDLSRLKDIENNIDYVVSEDALNEILSIVKTIGDKHSKDEMYIIKIDVLTSKIEKRRIEITKDQIAKNNVDSIINKPSKN